MSGDVQPRKRKDKKRKRDSLDRRSEGELIFSRKQSLQDDEPREQHQGVHGSKMGSDDVHLHVQGDHETGGHWCAKIFFFSLLAILLGLVGLIILENRGLSDLDTPLSESRFSNYFNGWVDEHRESHDEHDAVTASIEEHEHGDEPFEEEEDHSEADEADDDDDDEEEKDHDHEEEEEEDDDEDEVDTKENEEEEEDEEDENATEEVEAEDTPEEDNQTAEDDEDNDDKTVEETKEDEDEDANDNDDEDNVTKENENNEEADDDDDDDTAEVEEPIYTRSQRSAQQATSTSTKEEDDDDDEPFEEEDDDGTFESLESVVVDNDAEELLLLQEKARQQQEASKKDKPQPEEETSSYTSSLAVKIGVGVALALVARLVLIRKNPNTNEPTAEALMKRRLTIASPEDTFPEDADELLEYDYSEDDILNRDHDAEEEYIEEEVEEEEEIEVTDEEYEEKTEKPKYVPETFEQFSAMYRPKGFEPEGNGKKESPPKTSTQTVIEPKVTKSLESSQRSEPESPVKATQLRFAQYHRETPPPAEPKRSPQPPSAPPPQALKEAKNVHQYANEPEEEAEYDEDELYDDEMLDEEEEEDIADDEGDEEDLSDVDDSELMNRLEAKYGRLPAREYESDEDVDDQSWTKIKSRGGGPQSIDDDAFEEELRRANEEMLRESYNSALIMFESLSKKFPDKPKAFLGKAKTLDKLSEIHRSNSKLNEALESYKRYLAFGEDIRNDREFTEVAQRCVDRMRFMGLNQQAVPVHEMLIERFPKEVSHRNQLVVTYLMGNRLLDAKRVLEEIISRWPADGFALVHYGFVLKSLNGNLNLAVQYLRNGIDSQAEGTQDGRFYFNLGDGLQRLGRVDEARQVYRRGAALKLFLSEYQRSLYNVNSLRAQPFWTKKETGYEKFFNHIESNWRKIREEGLSALNAKGVFQDEAENLRDSGDWKQFELFARGQRRRENCMKAPITCGIIEAFPAARFCKRGQVKFSVMHSGTHVWPHCGPTNCRLRAHLGLKVPPGTVLRVANEERTWQEGNFLIFDDSFEHEVWHNGTSLRLVLIVDIWHPDLTEQQRQSLTPI